jgi:membrane-associated phospholipid phosphatase
MLAALTFYGFLFLLCVILPVALILLVLLLLEHERRIWLRIGPRVGRIGAWLGTTSFTRIPFNRFPRTIAFFGRRFDPHDAWGLRATIAAVGIAVGLVFFLDVVQSVTSRDPLATLDLRLHNTVPLFRSAGVTVFMLVVTECGGAVVLSIMSVGLALIAISHGQRRLAATFISALGVTAFLSMTLKGLFDYARPTDALVGVYKASFPSGHMLSGSVVYGLMAAVLLSSQLRRPVRALGVTLLLLLIVGIGLSRLYLGVHWPSDLLGSLALALVILVALLFFLHYDKPVSWIDSLQLPLSSSLARRMGSILIVIGLCAAPLLAHQTMLVPISPPQTLHAIDAVALTTAYPADLPRRSEDLIGGKMEPISLVLVAGENDLIRAFTQAGWRRADLPSAVRVVKEALAALGNHPDPAGPATPAYVGDKPQTITFEKPGGNPPTIRRRHHTRLWQTHYCVMPSCRAVWVATASYDIGIGLTPHLHLPTHRIDPDIDSERAFIVTDLVGAGAMLHGVVAIIPRLSGANAAGDQFSTDGRAVVLALPSD